MKCRKCGATVLKVDQTCKKCGATLMEATEVYSADKIYRSRFTLLFRAWMGAYNGAHLEWLGYHEKAKQIKSKYGMKFLLNNFLDAILCIFLHPVKSFVMFCYLLVYIVYFEIEITAIMCGKYREDANGHPVRYFNPYKK